MTKGQHMEQSKWSDFAEGGADKHGWRTIESAPRDGTYVDLWAYDKKHNRWGRRPDCRWAEMTDWAGEEYEGWAGLLSLHCDWQPPTHWRLPPAPPEDIES